MTLSQKYHWLDCVSDILADEAVRSMDAFPQHRTGFSCYRHCIWVSQISFRLCGALGWNAREAARGALLHDLYLYNWMDRGLPGLWRHLLDHPAQALENAKARFPLTDREADIIRSHMFPISTVRHHYRESVIVELSDKFCALSETLGLFPRRLDFPQPSGHSAPNAVYPAENRAYFSHP